MNDNEPIEAYPLSWPLARKRTPAKDRKRAAFRKSEQRKSTTSEYTYRVNHSLTVYQAVRRVREEISAFTRAGHSWVINPETVVVSTNVPTKVNGDPYSNAREPDDPGVAVYFRLRGKPHCVTCDRWDRVADNIAAVAKHLEAVRGIERWGTADVESLFAGFRALPATPAGTSAGIVTTDQAAAFLAKFGGGVSTESILAVVTTYQQCWRHAAIKLHPDRHAGQTPAEWHVLQQAKAILDRHHKV